MNDHIIYTAAAAAVSGILQGGDQFSRSLTRPFACC